MIEIINNQVIVNKKKLGTVSNGITQFSNYIRLQRDESKHTFWKFKAWGINKELADFAIKYKLSIIVIATHKSGELSNYSISCDELRSFIEKYECEFGNQGEIQYVIPKTFFHYKRENEALYTNPTCITNMHNKRFNLQSTESTDTVFIR